MENWEKFYTVKPLARIL